MKTKIIKISIWVIVIILTLLGSFSGFERGVWPFYVQKSGKTFGINFCLWTNYLPGSSHNGINISLVTDQQEHSKINGESTFLCLIVMNILTRMEILSLNQDQKI